MRRKGMFLIQGAYLDNGKVEVVALDDNGKSHSVFFTHQIAENTKGFLGYSYNRIDVENLEDYEFSPDDFYHSSL